MVLDCLSCGDELAGESGLRVVAHDEASIFAAKFDPYLNSGCMQSSQIALQL